jgi:predicted RNA-binding protein YlxR (DUF448 family)
MTELPRRAVRTAQSRRTDRTDRTQDFAEQGSDTMGTRKIPLRKCIGCGELREKKEMIRVIRTAEGNIEIDRTGRKNGRGAYICQNPECLRKAGKNHGLEHSLRVSIPEEVYRSLEEEMEKIDG